jgi:16S rRNA (adenine(1408)-N(1))-methyltransferase
VIDLGTGDGRAVLTEGMGDAGAFVIGIDADARAMADSSTRAHRGRGTRPALANVVFVASGVETLPPGLDGIADSVTVRFPWGSLLRGALGLDPSVARSIARLVAPGGVLEIIVSIVERDGLGATAGFGPLDVERMTAAFDAAGLARQDACRLTDAEVRATNSTWASRLRTDQGRPVWRVRFVRPPRPPDHGDHPVNCMKRMRVG